MNRIGQFAAAIALLASTSTASAQWYAGAQGAWTQGGPDASNISSQLVNDLGYFSAQTSTDNDDGGWRVFGGYQFLPWLAVEGGYLDAGRSKWWSTVQPPGTVDASLKTTAWTLGLAARYPFNDRFSVHGRISAAWTETKGSFNSSGFVDLETSSLTERRTVAAYAVGVEWAFNRNLAARFEVERLPNVSAAELGGRFDLDLVSLGLRWQF